MPTPAGDVGQVVEDGLALTFGYDFLGQLQALARLGNVLTVSAYPVSE
jgi:hypothetical protein